MNFKRLLILLLPLLVGCAADYDSDVALYTFVVPNAPIAELRSRALSGESLMRDGCVFEGRVTANDAGGNFYQTIVVEDSSGAVAVNLGFWSTASLYPVGLEVALEARGLSFAIFDGVVNIGLKINPWSDYRVEPFGSRIVADRHLFRTAPIAETPPTELALSELNDDLCGRLVRIGGLVYCGEQATWGEGGYGSTAVGIFATDTQNIAVETSIYADFAAQPIPRCTLALTGILYAGGGDAPFTLKLRSADDIELQ